MNLLGLQDKIQEPGDTISLCIVIFGLPVDVRESRVLRGKGAPKIFPRRNNCATWQGKRNTLTQNQKFPLCEKIGPELKTGSL
jgi:hypothetical protein